MPRHGYELTANQGCREANMFAQTPACMQANSMLELSIIKKPDQGDSVSIHFKSVMGATWNKY